jgi:hypothetical protein
MAESKDLSSLIIKPKEDDSEKKVDFNTPDGKLITISTTPNMTTQQVKEKLASLLGLTEPYFHLRAAKQDPKHCIRDGIDFQKALKHYFPDSSDKVVLEIAVGVMFEMPNGRVDLLYLKPDTTVSQAMERLQDLEGIFKSIVGKFDLYIKEFLLKEDEKLFLHWKPNTTIVLRFKEGM